MQLTLFDQAVEDALSSPLAVAGSFDWCVLATRVLTIAAGGIGHGLDHARGSLVPLRTHWNISRYGRMGSAW